MKKIRFCTFYLPCSNVELAKDVGQIPFTLARYYNVEASIACYNLNRNGINSEVLNHVEFKKVKKILKNDYLSAIVFIMKNARKIDWLNLYHGGRFVYYISKLYKLVNPSGRVYLKLDMDYRLPKLYDVNKKERDIFTKVSRVVDYISVEAEELRVRIQKYSEKKINIIRNGFYFNNNILKVKKEKIFLTVGRLGTEQKATDVLLEAFRISANYHDFNLELIGPIQSEFKPYLKSFLERNENLKDRIIIKGCINEREKIILEYAKAKVFVLPSRWEGFPLVGPEAMKLGCRIIVSDAVPPANIFTANGKYGSVFPVDNVEALASCFIREANEINKDETKAIMEYADITFQWKNNCKWLLEAMKEIR